ncbi:MAG TPA: hypothetical protein VHV54_01615 [Candidatus Binatia bacterium]|nr:hypothetical protein [Candidatus Binatia bacterium]
MREILQTAFLHREEIYNPNEASVQATAQVAAQKIAEAEESPDRAVVERR